MPYFLANQNLSKDLVLEISGDEAVHILLAHRSKKGDVIKLQGLDKKRFEAEILEKTKKSLTVKILTEVFVPKEPAVELVLFQSVVSEKALDLIFQKATELGASKIILFNSNNTAVKLSEDHFAKKTNRWNKILSESAKQSERSIFPTLEFVTDLKVALKIASGLGFVLLADQAGGAVNLNGKVSSLGLMVGPEGGFTVDEIALVQSLKNCQTVSLGNFVLRAETAAIALLSVSLNSLK